jgi:hypothetical protein
MEQAATREAWAKRIERWKDSGLTAKEFAAEIGISPRSLVWWRWRLASKPKLAAPAPPVKRRRRRDKAKPATPSPMTFVEVPAVAASEPIELVLPSSIRIRVGPSFDSATLERVLDVLAGRR